MSVLAGVGVWRLWTDVSRQPLDLWRVVEVLAAVGCVASYRRHCHCRRATRRPPLAHNDRRVWLLPRVWRHHGQRADERVVEVQSGAEHVDELEARVPGRTVAVCARPALGDRVPGRGHKRYVSSCDVCDLRVSCKIVLESRWCARAPLFYLPVCACLFFFFCLRRQHRQ